MIKLIELLIALLMALLAGQETGSEPSSAISGGQDAPTPHCYEDMPCWDCETMGNLICGRPQFEVRPLQPVVGPTVPCTTDTDCIEKNPHVIEDPDCEWVDGECLTFEQRVARQAEPDWSSGGETVCVLDPAACEVELFEPINEGEHQP